MLTHGRVRNTTVAIYIGTTIIPLGNHQVLAYAYVLIKIIGRVYTSRDSLVISLIHQTVLVDIVGREHVATLIRSVRDAGRQILCPCRAVNLVLPIRVGGIDTINTANQLRSGSIAI